MPEKSKRTRARPETISAEPWELQAVHREFPTHTEEELEPAIQKCKEQKTDTKNSHELAECVSEKIR